MQLKVTALCCIYLVEGKTKMNDEKQNGGDIVIKKGKFLTWLDNYWYHYKWPTIVVAFFLIVFLVCTLQICTRQDNDILVTYAGPNSLSTEEKVAIEAALNKALPESFAGKDDATAGFVSYYVLSQSQIESMEKQTDSEGHKLYSVDRSFVSGELSTFDKQLGTGSGSIILIDKWIYERDGMEGRLTPLADVFGETPKGAIDEYAIRLGDTEFYKNNPQLSFLNPDTVICLHAKIFGQKNYENEIEAFKAYATIAKSDTATEAQ